jgi:hypothetical protein
MKDDDVTMMYEQVKRMKCGALWMSRTASARLRWVDLATRMVEGCCGTFWKARVNCGPVVAYCWLGTTRLARRGSMVPQLPCKAEISARRPVSVESCGEAEERGGLALGSSPMARKCCCCTWSA